MNTKSLLIFLSIFLFINQNTFSQNAGVPIDEYNSLKELYDNSNGPGWINSTNWMDTTNCTVDDWYGVTLENGHVSKIELPNNNLQEGIFFHELINWPELSVLNLSGNSLIDANFSNLDSLSNLTSLHIENNKFTFKQILPIFDNPYFEHFSTNFTYAPQAKIGEEENIHTVVSDTVSFTIQNYEPVAGNQFTWYRNNESIANSNSEQLIWVTTTQDYLVRFSCKVTNPRAPALTLSSQPALVYAATQAMTDSFLIFRLIMEYPKLQELWTDARYSMLPGVTMENGRVIALDLSGFGLEGSVSSYFGDFQSLRTLNLSDNDLQGPIPRFEKSDSLHTFSLTDNNFSFADLIPVTEWPIFGNFFANFNYTPQKQIGFPKQVTVNAGELIEFSIDGYEIANEDKFQWYKNNVPLNVETTYFFDKLNADADDTGVYHLEITNPTLPDLTIRSADITVDVLGVGAGIPSSEYQALEKFYTLNNGDNWAFKENWLDTTSCSVEDWFGITVENGHVSGLLMDSVNNIELLPEKLIELTYLKQLVLFGNKISGDFPDWIGELSNLEFLSFGGNQLTGTLPENLGQLNNLRILEVASNEIEGTIPPELENATKLELILLSRNNLSGTIPAELGNLNNLRYLDLEHNKLNGTIPASLGTLTNLTTLDLSHNQLVGPLPAELGNLQNIYRFDIDNNLIGNIETEKSALILKYTDAENNRQIPDELSALLEMDTLYLGGNKLQFNDIEAIFDWGNFSSFKDFVYYPQGLIGATRTENKSVGDSITIKIENYYPGPSDKYQWYKDGNAINAANDVVLTLNNLDLSDAGEYYCVISNTVATELELTSKDFLLNISNPISGAGVPHSEYEALVNLSESFDGILLENWLDTTNHTVADWQGVTVENEHVTAIDLSGLNLTGSIPSNLITFDSLIHLDLSNNNLSGPIPSFINDVSSEKSNQADTKLEYFNIANNNFVFADLEPIAEELNAIDEFVYWPQALIGEPLDTFVYKDQSINFNLMNYSPGDYDSYSWMKENDEITGADGLTYTLEHATLPDSGYYSCSITNLLFPELTLNSDTTHLKVLIPSAIYDLGLQTIKIYPNPAAGKVYIDTQFRSVDLTVYNLVGNILIRKQNYTSGWINTEQYPTGIYLFKISDDDISITKKVMINH